MRDPSISLIVSFMLTGPACVKDREQATPVDSSRAVSVHDQHPKLVVEAPPAMPAAPPEGPAEFGPWVFDGPCPAGMVLIEGGQFEQHQRQRLAALFSDHRGLDVDAVIAPFCLSLYETSHQEFWECAKAGECTVSDQFNSSRPAPAECRTKDSLCSPSVAATAASGMIGEAAVEYCRARGGRLPTIVEWYWVALGGSEDRHYPWGDAPPPSDKLVNVCDDRCADAHCELYDKTIDKDCARERLVLTFTGDDGYGSSAPMDSFPAGVGRWGHFNLLGNVAEFVTGSTGRSVTAKCGRSHRSLKAESLDLHDDVCPSHSFDAPGIRCAIDPR